MAAGDHAGRKGSLQVIASGIGLDVQHLAGEIEPLHQARGHGPRIDLFGVDPSGGYDGFLQGPVAHHGQTEILEQMPQGRPLDGGDLVGGLVGRDAAPHYHNIDHLLGQQSLEEISIGALAVDVQVTLQPRFQLFGAERRLEVDG